MTSFNLQVQHISKHFGSIRVFDDLTFTHQSGVLGIAGPNGSGKSTLLQCLGGLKRPSSGTIKWEVDGKPIKTTALKTHIGFASSYINMYKELSCRENLDFLLKLRGLKNRSPAIQKALQQVGLVTFIDQPFNKLSTGQQQRLRLASALIHKPDILFLDEPGSNLDEQGKMLVKKRVEDFKSARKMIFIASNSSIELGYCDKVFSVEKEQFI